MEARLTGTVKWFSLAEGVGLIDPDNHTQQDVLVERSALVDRHSLEKGERVVFDLRTTARGWEAAVTMMSQQILDLSMSQGMAVIPLFIVPQSFESLRCTIWL